MGRQLQRTAACRARTIIICEGLLRQGREREKADVQRALLARRFTAQPRADARETAAATAAATARPPPPPELMPAPDLAGARLAAVIRHDLPLKYAGKGDALAREDADLRPGSLRVSILEAEGLPARPDGSACRPHVVISVAELTRRRCRRTASLSGPTPEWNESFDLDEVSGSGQVVVDLWDAADGSAEPDLMGKAVISLDECRPGVPHTFFKNMLVGKLAFRVLFDHGDLPDATEEAAQVQQSLATALS